MSQPMKRLSEKCFWYAFSDPQQLLFMTIVTTPMLCLTAVSISWEFITNPPSRRSPEPRAGRVADVDVLDARIVVEPVEHVQKRRSDDSEYVLDALDLQHLADGSSAHPGFHVRAPSPGRHRRLSARNRIPGAPA